VVLKTSKQAYPSVLPRPLLQSHDLVVPGSQGLEKVLDQSLERAVLTSSALRSASTVATATTNSSVIHFRSGGHGNGGVSGLATQSEVEQSEALSQELSVGVDKQLLRLMQAACKAER